MTTAATSFLNNSDTTNGTSFTTGSATFLAGRLYLLWVVNTKATTPNNVNSAAGTGITFATLGTPVAQTPLRGTLMWAIPVADTTTAIVIDFAGVTQTGCMYQISEWTGAAGSSAVINVVYGSNAAATALSITLASGTAGNGVFGGFANQNGSVDHFVMGSGYTELAYKTMASPTANIVSEWRNNFSTTCDISSTSYSASAMVGVGAEVVAASATLTLTPTGSEASAASGTPGTIQVYSAWVGLNVKWL